MQEILTEISKLISMIVEPLVDYPDEITINTFIDEECEDKALIEISVNEDDIGRVIGRSGRTIKSLRTLVRACASKYDIYVDLELLD